MKGFLHDLNIHVNTKANITLLIINEWDILGSRISLKLHKHDAATPRLASTLYQIFPHATSFISFCLHH